MRTRMVPRRAAVVAALCAALAAPALLAPAGAASEERTVEAIGVNGFTPPQSLSRQRQAAVSEGVRAAVYRVVADALPALDDEAAGGVARRVVGGDAREYVTRFRVVEDRGVQDRELTTRRDATHEYVVVVEAAIDVSLVRERLRAAGMLASGDGSLRRVELTLEELPSWMALEAVREALVDQIEAESAIPVEFTAHRAVLAVVTRRDGRSLLDRLVRADLGGFRLEPRGADAGRAVAVVRVP